MWTHLATNLLRCLLCTRCMLTLYSLKVFLRRVIEGIHIRLPIQFTFCLSIYMCKIHFKFSSSSPQVYKYLGDKWLICRSPRVTTTVNKADVTEAQQLQQQQYLGDALTALSLDPKRQQQKRFAGGGDWAYDDSDSSQLLREPGHRPQCTNLLLRTLLQHTKYWSLRRRKD